MVNRELLAPCGLYCGVCGAYLATRTDNPKLRQGMAQVYGCAPEDINCLGCLSDVRYKHCEDCAIRDCAQSKGYTGCHQCGEFPCDKIEALDAAFPDTPAGREVRRAIAAWRDLDDEAFAAAQEARWTCRSCGARLMRGQKICHQCRETVVLA